MRMIASTWDCGRSETERDGSAAMSEVVAGEYDIDGWYGDAM